jgi:hypothetical protein
LAGLTLDKIRLDLVGIVAIASLDTIARWTALRGSVSLFDSLVICPGLHRQQDAPDLAKGEYPACAAMTTGYVFRVENEATVFQLQRLGKPGHLTTLKVSSAPGGPASLSPGYWKQLRFSNKDAIAPFSYSLAVMLCVTVWILIAILKDWCGLISLSVFILARLINVVVITRRMTLGWKGEPEPGKEGDLIILLSQDRWIRMRGLVDDLKAVTSGQWLRKPTFIEDSLSSFATLLVYCNVALAQNARPASQQLLLVLFVSSAALLGICNHYISKFRMYDKVLLVDGEPKEYNRRLQLADELIEQTGRRDWAIRLGMKKADEDATDGNIDQGPKIM